jgi:hypothetical protein
VASLNPGATSMYFEIKLDLTVLFLVQCFDNEDCDVCCICKIQNLCLNRVLFSILSVIFT